MHKLDTKDKRVEYGDLWPPSFMSEPDVVFWYPSYRNDGPPDVYSDYKLRGTFDTGEVLSQAGRYRPLLCARAVT